MTIKKAAQRFLKEEEDTLDIKLENSEQSNKSKTKKKIIILDLEDAEHVALWEVLQNTPEQYKVSEEKTVSAGNKIRVIIRYIEIVPDTKTEEDRPQEESWETVLN